MRARNHEIAQHFFFLEKRKPVLKVKTKKVKSFIKKNYFYGKGFFLKERSLVEICVICGYKRRDKMETQGIL
ncbi:MAG: hypothetical protein J7K81_06180, partial [Methanophagales archaeon]|nr:hypothetical protein [Methanophagales archaeon]